MAEEFEGSTVLTGYTEATSVFDATVVSSCNGHSVEEDSWMASKHGHLLPIDTDKLEVTEKPSERLERHLAWDTVSERAIQAALRNYKVESRDDETQGPEEPVNGGSKSSHGSKPKLPTDSYLESLHMRLESTHFRRDEKEEDFIDFLFEKIELVACEMDGEKETLRDILDDTFEFLEDVTCGRSSRRRNASIRASFEKFLQSIDKLAAIYPKKDKTGDSLNNKDLLDALCDHFEKINLVGRTSDFVEDATKAAKDVVASAARTVAMPCSDTKDDTFSFMSISEETGELPMANFSQKLPRISEEYSLFSGSSRSRTLRRIPQQQKQLSPQQLREELIRRNNFKRMRGNIHVNLSKKTVANKMLEAKDAVEDACVSVGDYLATIFENMEMGIWDVLVLGANSSADSNSLYEVTADRSTDFLMDASSEEESLSQHPTQNALFSTSESFSVDAATSNMSVNSGEYYDSIHDRNEDPALIHATSSEDTYASGCGAGHKGPAAKRFQMVDQMKKLGNNADVGRSTPNSHVTGSTCDETVSSDERGSPDADSNRRELCAVASDSVRLERMEMVAYMSIHNRSVAIDSNDNNSQRERSCQALSLDASAKESSPAATEIASQSCPGSVPTSSENTVGLSARLEETPEEVSFATRMPEPAPSLNGGNVSVSNDDEQLDLSLGKASNRSSRSVWGNPVATTSPGIEEVPSIPHLSTTDESFYTAQQSIDFGESDEPHVAVMNGLSRKSRFPNIVEDCPDDELHRAGGWKGDPRSSLSPSLFCKSSSEKDLSLVPADNDSSSPSWGKVMNAILHRTKVGGGWVGEQTMKVMVMLLFVSASTAMAANGALKAKFQDRRREFDEKMTAYQSSNPDLMANSAE